MLPKSVLWEKVRKLSEHATLLCISVEYLVAVALTTHTTAFFIHSCLCHLPLPLGHKDLSALFLRGSPPDPLLFQG